MQTVGRRGKLHLLRRYCCRFNAFRASECPLSHTQSSAERPTQYISASSAFGTGPIRRFVSLDPRTGKLRERYARLVILDNVNNGCRVHLVSKAITHSLE
jgi:hypothetical protein